MNDTLTSN